MGEYNPDRPYVLGMQWAPLVRNPLTLDTASEVGYVFRAAGEDLERVWLRTTSPPPGRPSRKELVANLYRADAVAGTGPLRKLVIPCSVGELLTGAALAGAASSADAVANPSDQRHITLTGPNAAVRFWFRTTTDEVKGALFHRRIIDVTVLYVISGPFADLAPAVTLGLERPSAGVVWPMDETLTGPAAHSDVTVVRRSRLGELNPWWSTTATPVSTTWRRPYSWAGGLAPTSGLTAWSAPGGTNVNVRLQVSAAAPAGTQFQVHYMALEVTYGEENRVAAGGLDITNGVSQDASGLWYQLDLVQMYNFGFAPSLLPGYPYAITVGQAHAGQLSVASPVPVPVDRLGMVDELPSLRGVLLRKTLREGAVPTVETVNELPALTLYAGTPLPGVVDGRSHSYLAQAIATVARRHFPGQIVQRILDDTPGTYVWIRFYARHLPGTRDPLTVYQADPADPWTRLGPRAQISVDEFDALPEVADGWKAVTLRLDPPLVTAGPGANAVTWWVFDTLADDESPWQILGADTQTDALLLSSVNDTTYGGQTAFATIDGVDDVSSDLTVMLVREMDPVTGFAVQPAVQALNVVDEQCVRPVGGIPTGIHYHALTWDAINSDVVAGWGWYEVQRQDDTMDADEWETIARVGAPHSTAVDDYEARVGVESRYRIRMVHRIGVAGPWSAPVAATIPAPGVTGTRVDVGVLILTSNHNPAGNLAYVTNPERSGEEFTFPEAGQVELQAMFDRDFRAAFRPLERGGVEFTRTLLVNAAAVPGQTLDKGFRDLRDLAWDTVPYVCVRDELDNRWLATLLVPGGTVRRHRRRGHMQLAQVTVMEVTDTPAPVDGGPPPCEGLRPEGTVSSVTAEADDPAGIAWDPKVVIDQFGRDVAGGLGATETPGLPWQVVTGPAAELSVTGGVARWSVVNVDKRAITGPALLDVDIWVRVRVNQLPLTQPINAYLHGRWVDGANAYAARLAFQPNGTLQVGLEKIVGGTFANLAALTTATDHEGANVPFVANAWYWFRMQVRGQIVRAAAWKDEPGSYWPGWTVQEPDGGLLTAGSTGLRAFATTGNTNVGAHVEFDSYEVREPMRDVDIRVELRTSGDLWRVVVEHLSQTNPEFISSGWDIDWSDAQTCFEVFDQDVFFGCLPTSQLGVVRNQRRWLRAVYEQDTGGGSGRVTFYWSLDGVTWQGGTSVLDATPEPLDLDSGFFAIRVEGDVTVSRVEIRNGVDGPLVVAPDFEAQPKGTKVFVDAHGASWEVDGVGICGAA
jgi:hypothetical protein